MADSERMKRKKSEKRDQILESARRLFYENGYANTRVDDIAKDTDLAIGTLYLYFENKNDIYASLCQEGLGIMEDLFTQTNMDGMNCWEKMATMVQVILKFYGEYPDYWGIMTYLFLSSRLEDILADLRHEILEGITRVLKRLEEIIREGIAAGDIRECNVDQTVLLLWAKILGLVYCDRAGLAEDLGLSLGDMIAASAEMTIRYLKD